MNKQNRNGYGNNVLFILYPGDGNPCVALTPSGGLEAYGTISLGAGEQLDAVHATIFHGYMNPANIPDSPLGSGIGVVHAGAVGQCALSGVQWCFEGSNVITGAQGNCEGNTLVVWGTVANNKARSYPYGWVYFRGDDGSGESGESGSSLLRLGNDMLGQTSHELAYKPTPSGRPLFAAAPRVYKITYPPADSLSMVAGGIEALEKALATFVSRHNKSGKSGLTYDDTMSALDNPVWTYPPDFRAGAPHVTLMISRHSKGLLMASLTIQCDWNRPEKDPIKLLRCRWVSPSWCFAGRNVLTYDGPVRHEKPGNIILEPY